MQPSIIFQQARRDSRMSQTFQQPARLDTWRWLRAYYFTRAGVSIAWVAAAVTVGTTVPLIAAALLLGYPAWDAIANIADARRSGGLIANPTQALNAAISVVTTIAVLFALGQSLHAVLAVFGVWAILSGVLQFATAVRRRETGAQWAMILSGVQSMLAGGFFISLAAGTGNPGIKAIAPYAAFGAFYFLVAAVWLTVRLARQQ
jgi:uncharacterized membrane protein HdeD (DUF308 family)